MGKYVLVVGAGISGLAAAYELTKQGHRVRVREASSRAGGLIHTEHAAGFTIEAGPDSILNAKPAAVDLIRELGLEDELMGVRQPGAFVLKGHTLHALPQPSFLGIPLTTEALATYDLLSPEGRARMAQEPTVPAGPGHDESVGSFFRRRFGPEAVDLIAQPLLGGIHAGDIDQLSMRSLFPRLLDLERAGGSVLPWNVGGRPSAIDHRSSDIDHRSSNIDHRSSNRGFSALRGGMGTMVRALEAALPPGTIEYNSRVESLDDPEASAVIIAAHAYSAARLLRPIDPEAARLCDLVPYVSTASVALAWPRDAVPHSLNGTGFVVARRYSDVRITACTWVSSKWESRAPDDSVLLRAFIGSAHDPDVVDLSDEELMAIARRDVRGVLGVTEAPVLARVYRWRRAGAQHLVGHLDRVLDIERRLAPRGIFVAGSGFRATGIPDCVADGRRVAAEAGALLAGGRPT